MRTGEILGSFVVFALVTAGLFHDVSLGGRTVSSAPHIPFTLPEGPVDYPRQPTIPLLDPYGPGWIHEANHPYRDAALRDLEIPFWHPYEACGNPYLAGLLPGLFFPPNWLMHVGAPPLGFDLAYLARVFLAGWFMYLLLRVHRLRPLAAGIGGLFFLGSGYMVLSMNLSNAAVECAIPGLLLGLECALAKRRRRDLALLVSMVFLVLIGGNPQASFLALVLGGIYTLFRLPSITSRRRFRALTAVATGHLLGALLAAPQLALFLEFLPHAAHLHHPGLGMETQRWETLVQWFVPGFYRNAYEGVLVGRDYFHFGALPIVLGVAGWLRGGPVYLKRFATCALLLVGAWYFSVPPFSQLGLLPGFSQILIEKYLAVYLCFFASVAGAIGVDRLAAVPPRKAARALAVGATLTGLVPALFTLLWQRGSLQTLAGPNLTLAATDPVAPHFGWLPAFLLLLVVAAAICARRPNLRPLLLGIVALVCGIETVEHRQRPYPPRANPYRPPPFLEALRGDPGTFRVYSPDHILYPNTATIFGLHDIRYAEAMKIRRYAQLVETAFDYPEAANYFPIESKRPGAPVHALSLLGVRYCLSSGPLLPLHVGSLGPIARKDFTVDLSGGPVRLTGTVVNANETAGAVRVWALEGGDRPIVAGGQPDASNDWHPLEFAASVPERRLPYLAIHVGPGGNVDLRSVTFNGVRVSPATLAATAYHDVSIRDDAVAISGPNVIPFTRTDRIDIRTEARVRASGPARIGLILERARLLGTVRGGAEAKPFSIDLSGLPARHVQVSVEVVGAAVVSDLALLPDGIARPTVHDGVRVYENRRFVPRVYGVYEAEVVQKDSDQLTRVLDLEFDAARHVVVDAAPDIELPSSPPAERPHIRIVEEAAGGASVVLDAHFPANGLLVLLDNHFPGWRATVDGRDVPIARANYTFRAVPVPAGTHRVVFTYRPASWLPGLALGALGLIGLVGMCFRWRVRPAGRPEQGGAGG